MGTCESWHWRGIHLARYLSARSCPQASLQEVLLLHTLEWCLWQFCAWTRYWTSAPVHFPPVKRAASYLDEVRHQVMNVVHLILVWVEKGVGKRCFFTWVCGRLDTAIFAISSAVIFTSSSSSSSSGASKVGNSGSDILGLDVKRPEQSRQGASFLPRSFLQKYCCQIKILLAHPLKSLHLNRVARSEEWEQGRWWDTWRNGSFALALWVMPTCSKDIKVKTMKSW